MGEWKKRMKGRKLVVTGCMVQRYGASLEGELPEVDHFLGTGEYHRIADILRAPPAQKSFVDVPMYIHDELAPRVNSWSRCSAYLKISEGCDHRCAFCIIPQLRGRLRSRTVPSLVAEAARLASEGVVELNLVSQDTTAYGRDLRDGTDLGGLLRGLAGIERIRWIRLHYAYPIGLPKSLLDVMATEAKVVRYLDIPLQHASGPILQAMRRGVTRDGQRRILDRLRTAVPDLSIRTTFIVGFPGETDGDFRELVDFVQEQAFDHVGVFTYFQEEGTPAATFGAQVPERVKAARQAELLAVQKRISREKLRSRVGSIVPVLVEGPSPESDALLRGRTDRQAPDVDGQVIIASPPSDVAIGQIRPLRVTDAGDYDLAGEIVTA
jgi:ribosomal protein S12 methylthiotransferase